MNTQLQDAISATNFGVLDYDRFARNYENKTKYDEQINEFITDNYSSDEMAEAIISAVMNDYYLIDLMRSQLKEALETGKRIKTVVRGFKTLVNQATWQLNARYLSSYLPEMKESTLNGYASRAYLVAYKKINRAMKKALKTLINEYI